MTLPSENKKGPGTDKPRRRRVLVLLLILLVLSYVGGLVYVHFLQEKLAYHPTRGAGATPQAAGLDYEDVWLVTADGVRVHSWYVPKTRPRGYVIFSHGNAGNLSDRLAQISILNELGFASLFLDYRGFGRSGGRPTEQGTYLDVAAAWGWLVNKHGVRPEQVVLWGRSLGGAVAAHQAVKTTPGALVLESTFTDILAVGQRRFPFFPLRLVANRLDYDTEDILPEVRCPVLVVHSPDDGVVPYEHGQRLFEIAAEPKRFLKISGSHNRGFLDSVGEYKAGLDAFFRSIGWQAAIPRKKPGIGGPSAGLPGSDSGTVTPRQVQPMREEQR
ncbi:MAG: alpha/beta hydrolase [Desulfatibacillaceae bacterium]